MATEDARASDRSPAGRGDEPAPGVVFEVLADETRRLVLHLLRARGGTSAVDELAARLVAYQSETGRNPLPTTSERGVATYLHLVVLPDLAEQGLVRYDAEGRAATFDPRSDELERYLEFARAQEPPAVDRFVERCWRSE